MTFEEIFDEYFVQFRGQATSVPTFSDREYKTAIRLGNNAIRTWDRVDGQLWRELIVTAQEQTTGVWATVDRTVSGTTMTPPNNMRKPPAFVMIGTSWIPVTPPQEAKDYSDNSSYIWFEGGANTGYTMHLGGSLASQLSGQPIDYVYIKKPTLLTTATTPAAIVVEMSDPNFMIQQMLSNRARIARNGLLYKTSSADAKSALLNMKIENDSGVWGNSDRQRDLIMKGQGWGVNLPVDDIRL